MARTTPPDSPTAGIGTKLLDEMTAEWSVENTGELVALNAWVPLPYALKAT